MKAIIKFTRMDNHVKQMTLLYKGRVISSVLYEGHNIHRAYDFISEGFINHCVK